MGWWLAPVYDRLLRKAEAGPLGRWRQELLADVAGSVLEIGAGTGANVPWYPDAVTHLTLCEPDPGMAKRLRAKLPGSPRFPIEVRDAPGERLPADDHSVDVVVSTLVLCTVRDPARSLSEIRRVLKPGGRFVFIEHVANEADTVRHALQRAVTPVWKLIGGGCHLDRKTADRIGEAGFHVEHLERRIMGKKIGLGAPYLWGHARS